MTSSLHHQIDLTFPFIGVGGTSTVCCYACIYKISPGGASAGYPPNSSPVPPSPHMHHQLHTPYSAPPWRGMSFCMCTCTTAHILLVLTQVDQVSFTLLNPSTHMLLIANSHSHMVDQDSWHHHTCTCKVWVISQLDCCYVHVNIF